LLQLAVVCASLFLALGYAKAKSSFQQVFRELEETPIRWGHFVSHLVAFLGFVGLSFLPAGNNASGLQATLVAVAWFATGSLAMALAGLAFIPARLAFRLVRSAGYVWIYALIAGVLACKAVTVFPLWNGNFWKPATDLAWKPATDLTFGLVKAFL